MSHVIHVGAELRALPKQGEGGYEVMVNSGRPYWGGAIETPI